MSHYICPLCGEVLDDKVRAAIANESVVVLVDRPREDANARHLVSVECEKGHISIVEWPPAQKATPSVGGGDEPPVKGRPVTPDEEKHLAELRGEITHEKSFKVLDDFGKWLFGGTAVVGSLAAGLGASGVAPLDGPQKVLFAVAVALIGFSLAGIVYALQPVASSINRNSIESIEEAFNERLVHRTRRLRNAGYAFAGGLLLAGIAPLLPGHWSPGHWRGHDVDGVEYAIAADGSVVVDAKFKDAAPRSIVRSALRVGGNPLVVLPRASTHSDDDGKASIQLALKKPGGTRSLWVVRTWRPEGDEALRQEVCFLALPRVGKPGGSAATAGRAVAPVPAC